MQIGRTLFEVGPGWCRTTLPDGAHLVAMAEDTDGYRKTAVECGYGPDTDQLCIDHELVHSLLAKWLGLPQSHTLTRVAHGNHQPTALTRKEEQAVLSIQAFAKAMGVTIRDLV